MNTKTAAQIAKDMGIEFDLGELSKLGKIIIKKYRKQHGCTPKTRGGRHVYYSKDYLMVMESIIKFLENEFNDRKRIKTLIRLEKLTEECDVLMLAVISHRTWDFINFYKILKKVSDPVIAVEKWRETLKPEDQYLADKMLCKK